VHRVADLEAALAALAARGVDVAARFDIPHGPAAELVMPGPQRIALFELTRPETAKRIQGRRDF
jgi:hypothetical protein